MLPKDPRPPMLIDQWVPAANFVNAHRLVVDAPPAEVWQAVTEAPASIGPTGAAGAMASLVLLVATLARGEGWRRASFDRAWSRGCDRGDSLGDPSGTCEAGLSVVDVDEGREMVLAGAHAYAAYATNFFLEALPDDRTRVHNVTRAKFLNTIPARLYFAGVRVFHDPMMAWTLARLRHVAESQPLFRRRPR